MRERLFTAALLGERDADVVVRLGKIRLERQGGAELGGGLLGDPPQRNEGQTAGVWICGCPGSIATAASRCAQRLLVPTFFQQEVPEIVEGLGIPGRALPVADDGGELLDGRVRFSSLGQGETEIVPGIEGQGIDLERLAEEPGSRGGISAHEQVRPQHVVGDEVPGIDPGDMGEQGHGVLPESRLAPRQEGQRREDRRGADPEERGAPPPRGRPGTRFPGDRDEEADERQVAVAVRHGLAPDLDDADDRHEGAQVPEPAQGEPGTAPADGHGQRRDAGEDREREQRTCRREGRSRVRVEGDEIHREQQPCRCISGRRRRVAGARPEREELRQHHRAAALLRQIGDAAGDGGEREERSLFQEQAQRGGARGTPANRRSPGGNRCSGHQSSSSRTKGSVTSIGLARRPSRKTARTARYRPVPGLRAYRR